MNSKRLAVAVGIVALMLSSAGCGGAARKAVADKTGVSVDNSGGVNIKDKAGGSIGLGTSSKLPTGWPGFLKLPSGSEINASVNNKTDSGSISSVGLSTSNTEAKAKRFFKDELEGAGYKGRGGPSIGSDLYEKDTHSVIVTVHGSNGKGGIEMSVSYATDSRQVTATSTSSDATSSSHSVTSSDSATTGLDTGGSSIPKTIMRLGPVAGGFRTTAGCVVAVRNGAECNARTGGQGWRSRPRRRPATRTPTAPMMAR